MKIRITQIYFLISLLLVTTFFFSACGGKTYNDSHDTYIMETPSSTPSPTPSSISEIEVTLSIRNTYNDMEPIKSEIYSDGILIGLTDNMGNLTAKFSTGIHDFVIKPNDSTNWNDKTASGIEIKEVQVIVFSLVPKFVSGTPIRFYISDWNTNTPIDSAQIYIYVGGTVVKTGVTTSNGVALIKDIPSGTIKIVLRKLGYGDYIVDGINIIGSEIVRAQYKMIPK